jgi:chemotaxis protein CheC
VQPALTELQRDALRELTNVGAGHGAAALSRLLGGERLGFQPPEAREASAEELVALLGGSAALRVVASTDVTGEASGSLWLVLTPEDAQALGTRLAGGRGLDSSAVDAALGRAAGAVAPPVLAAMGRLTGLSLEGAEPLVQRNSAGALARAWCGGDAVAVLDVLLHAPSFALRLLFLPAPAAVAVLLRTLRV